MPKRLKPHEALELAAAICNAILRGIARAIRDGEIEPLEVFRIAIDAVKAAQEELK
ncbi:MAG: hypothetical protein ACE5FM_05945 [Methyloligellaceae bacterium]